DDALPVPHPPDRRGQLPRRAVLHQEGHRPGLHGGAQVAGPAEGGQDHHPAAGHGRADPLGGRDAAAAGHLDVEQRDVGPLRRGDGDRLLAVAGLADDLDVGLQPEQRGERAPYHALVLGQHHSDHPASSAPAGTWTRRRKPPSGPGPASRTPPASRTRSASPASPLPESRRAPPCPSSTMSRVAVPSSYVTSIVQCAAPACRTTLVTPSRTAQASRASARGGSGGPGRRVRASTPAARSTATAPSISSARRR